MSLFGSIRLAANTLRADQIAMQVIGQNIANANTPGYIREETVLTPAPTQRMGNLLLGLGVRVEAVIQKIDLFLEGRLRGAVSEKASAEAQEEAYVNLEQIIGELSETDLSTALTGFFNSISEVLNQPENVSVRNLAVLNGVTLTEQIRSLSSRVAQVRSDVNARIVTIADDINRLTEEIARLNVQIAETEGGDVSTSDAIGLRDQRLEALERLAELIDIRVEEQPSGTVTVYRGGEFLVTEGMRREVKVVRTSDRGLPVAEIRIAETDSPLNPSAGELHGLTASRDTVLGGFLDRLDTFAATLAFEFNKVYSGGQGLNGFREVESEFAVTSKDAALDDAGLPFVPKTGSFEVITYRMVDGQRVRLKTTDVFINLTGLGHQTTLADVADALDAIDGLSASVNAEGRLEIATDSPEEEFALGNDTSGLLAAIGVNTFFTGSTAADLGVSQTLRDDPAKFAASRGGIGADTQNAVLLSRFLDEPIASQNGASLAVLYDRLVGETTQGATVARASAEGSRVFEQTLRGQKLAISGVSLDEEAVRMIQYQKSFQASARFIAALQEMFEMLVNL
ncbi:MAG: flagellar hook-associated protein FlgK [Thermoguttaceae bacterium]|jgi:flagellar hook-associated protein 1 FlgK|nr:flagellar hook-associated protein FlgK [Thermoguttaceae bacterium]